MKDNGDINEDDQKKGNGEWVTPTSNRIFDLISEGSIVSLRNLPIIVHLLY